MRLQALALLSIQLGLAAAAHDMGSAALALPAISHAKLPAAIDLSSPLVLASLAIMVALATLSSLYLLAAKAVAKPLPSARYAHLMAKARGHLGTGYRLRVNHRTEEAIHQFELASIAFMQAALAHDPRSWQQPALADPAHSTSNAAGTGNEAAQLTLDAYEMLLAVRKESAIVMMLTRNSTRISEAYRLVAQAHLHCALVYRVFDNFFKEISAYHAAIATYQFISDHVSEAIVHQLVAQAYKAHGHIHSAIHHYEQSASLFHGVGAVMQEAQTCEIMVSIYTNEPNYPQASRMARRAAQTFRTAQDFTSEARLYMMAAVADKANAATKPMMDAFMLAARAYSSADNHKGAADTFSIIADEFAVTGSVHNEIVARMHAAEAYLACQHYQAAGRAYEHAAQLHQRCHTYIKASNVFGLAEHAYKTCGDQSAAERMQHAVAACEQTPRLEAQQAHDRLLHNMQQLSLDHTITVRRSHLLADSLRCILSWPRAHICRTQIKFQFNGERGIDYGGVSREWFYLVTREMTSPEHAFFITRSPVTRTYLPNPDRNDKASLSHFMFFGRVIGLAINMRQLVGVRLARSLLKQMLGLPLDFGDIQSLNPALYDQLQMVQQTDQVSDLALYFTLGIGPGPQVELCHGGANILVTNDNKAMYIRLVTDMLLRKSIGAQLVAFLRGFSNVVHAKALAGISPRALELLLGGDPVISVTDWKGHTSYEHYTTHSPVIVWFWEVVHAFSARERARLLQFITASPYVPAGGFSALAPKITIVKMEQSDQHMPSSVTCNHRLNLPSYSSKEILETKLRYAMDEGYLGFEFM